MSQLYMRWPKYWSFSLSISLSSEHPGLISIRMDWLDLLAVQGTLMSLLQHHSLRASILRHSGLYYVEVGSFYAHFLKSFLPGEGNGNPLQYSCLENPTDGGAWWATVHGSQRVDTTKRLHFHFKINYVV